MSLIIYVPILHSEKEVGKISGIAGNSEQSATSSPLQEMWEGIERKIEALNLTWNKTRIYQEALPVCGKEEQVVRYLAQKNSPNHRLIVELEKKGAHLEGTEKQDILLREYDLLCQALRSGSGAGTMADYRQASDVLLAERDQFIGERIKHTLKEDETGLLFIGVRHKLDQILKENYLITYIIYRIPFESVRAVYNL